MIPDLYSLLGVTSDVAPDELTARYLAIVNESVPRIATSASAEDRAALEQTFQSARRAYEILADPDRRQLYDDISRIEIGHSVEEAFTTPVPSHEDDTDASASERFAAFAAALSSPMAVDICDLCESVPAAPLRLKRTVGLVIIRKSYTFDAILCRTCASEAVRRYQIESLTKGWYGVYSAPINLWNIAANATRSAAHRQRVGHAPAAAQATRRPIDDVLTAGWYPDPSGRFAARYFNVSGRWERLCRDSAGVEQRDFDTDPTQLPPPASGDEASIDSPTRNRFRTSTLAPPGWYPDPSLRFAARYFNASGKWERLCRTSDGGEFRDTVTDPTVLPAPEEPQQREHHA